MAGDAVDQIKEKLTIEEVVTPYVELHKAGKHLKGKSPFTAEKTPSFYVSPDRGMYYCFSTNQGGDMFTFIQAMEGVDFKGALKILAEKAGVELVREDPKKRSEREQKYAALEAATKLYENSLLESGAKDALSYVTERGITDKTIQLWRIGFAPDEWRTARDTLNAQKFTDPILRAAGLVKGESGKDPYDVFRNRIAFPIFDPSGRVVAFSGRTLSSDKDTPKYVNSPETELFNKSEILYGYDKAKHGIRKFDFSLIVEGQFDVVLAHQAGYNNTVAVSGTALTPHHVNLLGRLSNRVVLALDADRAGLAAVKKAADIMLPREMDVKVARMPQGQDPADIIKDDPETFKKIIGNSVHVIEYLLTVLQKVSRDERALGIAISEKLLPLILLIPNSIEHEYFLGLIAERTGIGKDSLKLELARIAEHKQHRNDEKGHEEEMGGATAVKPAHSPNKYLEHKALFLLLPDLFEEVDVTKLKNTFNDLTGHDFGIEKKELPLDVEIREIDNFKKQNPNLAAKEKKEKIKQMTIDMYRSHLDHEITKVKESELDQEQSSQRIFELRKRMDAAEEIELDLFV